MSNPAAISKLSDARAYLLAGAAIFTLVSKKSGERRTFRVRVKDPQSERRAWFVDVLVGPENASDYHYLGFLYEGFEVAARRPDLRYKAKNPTGGPASQLFAWLVSILNGAGEAAFESKFAEQAEFWHSGSCARCGRLLTDPESIARGLGPTCAERS